VEAVDTSEPPRRRSKRSLILLVSTLTAGVLALVVGVVGIARSVDFVLRAVRAAANVGQIAPELAAPSSVTPASAAGSAPTPASAGVGPPAATPGSDAPPTAAPAAPSAGGSNGEVGALLLGAGAGGDGSAGDGGGSGGSGGVGTGGAAPLFWEGVAQSVLDLVRQSTITMCGPNTCNVGQVCCNASCGTCVAPGATCDQTQCAGAPRAPTNVLCGRGQCNDGQICCNPSCGICVAPGETCAEQECP
jgi:hypothetical protein